MRFKYVNIYLKDKEPLCVLLDDMPEPVSKMVSDIMLKALDGIQKYDFRFNPFNEREYGEVWFSEERVF